MTIDQSIQTLAVFDLDKTIIDCYSAQYFIRKKMGVVRTIMVMFRNLPLFLRWKFSSSTLGIESELYRSFYSGADYDLMTKDVDKVVAQCLKTYGCSTLLSRLNWHKDQNHHTVLLSYTPEFILRGFAKALGVDVFIAPTMEVSENYFTGEVIPANFFTVSKLEHLKDRFPSLDSMTLYAYGDSDSDLPLIIHAAHGYMYHHGKLHTEYKGGHLTKH